MWKMGIFLIFTSKTPGFFRAILYHSLPPPLLLLVLQWEVRSKVTFQHLWTLTGCVSQKSETQAVKVGSWRPLFTGVCLYFYIYIYMFLYCTSQVLQDFLKPSTVIMNYIDLHEQISEFIYRDFDVVRSLRFSSIQQQVESLDSAAIMWTSWYTWV